MKTKKSLILVAVIAFLGLSILLAACGASPTTTSSNAAPATTVANSNNPATGANPPDGATQPTPPATGQMPGSTQPNPNNPPAQGRPGNGTNPGNPTPGAGNNPGISREQLENATPETIVKTFYNQIKSGESRAVLALTTQSFRQSFAGSNRTQISTALGLKPDQKVQDIQIGTSTVNGDKATLTATLTLTDGTKVTQNLSLVKGQVSRPNGNGQGVTIWQIDTIKVA
jgi:Domain of unknown function (DUF4878)